MARIKDIKDGEWIRPVHRGYKLHCCDCGLVHKMNFRIVKDGVEFQAFRVDKKHGHSTKDS